MPRCPIPLWELQGLQTAVMHGEAGRRCGVEKLELSQPGKLTPAQYQQATRDLTSFLEYASEPAALQRQHYGIWVLLFLAVSPSWPICSRRNTGRTCTEHAWQWSAWRRPLGRRIPSLRWGDRAWFRALVRVRVLTLYTTVDDVQCHRVRLVLAAKGVSYERVMVEPGKPPEDLIDLNPYASTPTLVDRDLTLYDTSVVCEYLDERYPHPPLMPIDPLSRARLRLAAVRIENDWLPEVEAIQAGGTAGRCRAQAPARAAAGRAAAVQGREVLPQSGNEPGRLPGGAGDLAPALAGCGSGAEGKPILDYGERLFHSQGYARSMTDEEKAMRP